MDTVPSRNPFRPAFGASPRVLAGRTDVIDDFQLALDEGPGSPGRTMLISGPRGMGKTVVLNELEDEARQAGWLVMRANPGPDLVDRLVRTDLPTLLQEHDPDQTERRMTGAGIAGLGNISTEVHDRYRPEHSLNSLLDRLTQVLAGRETGLLISVDELQSIDIEHLRTLTTAFQECVRDDRDIAFVGAGLPIGVKDLLDHPGTTFLRRAQRVDLGPVSRAETRTAFEETVRSSSRTITEAALERITELSLGYPYLIQLAGYHAWRQSADESAISIEHIHDIEQRVIQRLGTQIHQPALRNLSDTDRAYLEAMASDARPSSTKDIADRLGKQLSYQSVYRKRLLDQEIIVATSRGFVDFELPYMREYLKSTLQK